MMLLLLLLQVLASCLWLGHGEVVTSLERSCPQFFFNKTLPNAALTPQNPGWICQRYENKYYFATLYDRDLRIPVYSAYLYQPGPSKRCQMWMVEPQLMGEQYPKTMETESYLIRQFEVSIQELKNSQAVLTDYEHLDGFHRGHLNPCSHNIDQRSCISTFTLTNIVPQNAKLNQGAWKKYELTTMKNKTKGCAATYVIVGAVPGNSFFNNRVNNPSHIWSSACCVTPSNTTKAWGAIAENTKNEVQVLSLGQLENNLAQLYQKGSVSLFGSACPRQ
ncbi:endonuclease domain-containing 1 protein-like [Heliangelus exortis]|uniref:endonuclease domain-containing 1 protein-like n=1 Tax=Heliangelus exortis TaxID=472823 RepID=UPI003A947863